MHTRALAAGLAGTLGVTLAAIAPGQVANAAPRPEAANVSVRAAVSRAVASPGLRWHRCAESYLTSYGLKCASIAVPLDYAHPHGKMIHLELSRKRHTSSAKRYLGPMLVNPGGPGDPGLIYPALQAAVPHGVGGRFDWIGWDTRGVGASRPVLHCDPSYNGYDRPNYTPLTPALLTYWRSRTRGYAKACGSSGARRLLAHMSTATNARDMNAIREALGVQKISFYGFSWGTYLGEDFLTLFPNRVRRVVLDGVVDPGRVWYPDNLIQDQHFDANMNVFWQWVAKYDSTFHLGTDWKAIRAGFYQERTKLASQPAAGGKLGPDELTDAMLDPAYYVYDWVSDAQAYADLINKNNGNALLSEYQSGSVGLYNENFYAVFNAVSCVDNPWPGFSKTISDSTRVNRTAPFETWANTWGSAPCMFWPVKAGHRLYVHQKAGLPNMLLINETQDAATAYSGALAVRGRFKNSRLIAGVGGTTHASSLSGVSCVDNRIAHYLATGWVPARKPGRQADVRCGHVPRPVPTSGSARVRSTDRMMQSLREALEHAQRGMMMG